MCNCAHVLAIRFAQLLKKTVKDREIPVNQLSSILKKLLKNPCSESPSQEKEQNANEDIDPGVYKSPELVTEILKSPKVETVPESPVSDRSLRNPVIHSASQIVEDSLEIVEDSLEVVPMSQEYDNDQTLLEHDHTLHETTP
uniref:Uncharacterized protein n=1 Tax=Acrobeloides nanus TaxID=290746 RepID=A0A914EMX9_9BILA